MPRGVCAFYNTYTKGIPIEEGIKEDAGIQAWERDCFSRACGVKLAPSLRADADSGRSAARPIIRQYFSFLKERKKNTS